MSYTKLFSSIITSTIWTEDDRTRIIWITMLALADKNGEVQASIPGLAQISGTDTPSVETAIAKFLAPDEYSRTPDDQGRRVEPIPGGWLILNYGKYRQMATDEDRKEKAAERQKRFRDRQKRNASVTPPLRQIPQAEAEAEAEAEADTNTPTKQKKKTPLNPPKGETLPFSSEAFKDAWLQWGSHRKEIRKPLTPTSIRQQFKKLGAMSEADAIEMIENTIAMGWTGLRKPNENNGKSSKGQTGGAHGNAGSQCGGNAAKGIEVSRL